MIKFTEFGVKYTQPININSFGKMAMKIFLSASIYGKQHLEDSCKKIVDLTKKSGNTIVSDHILNTNSEEMVKWQKEKDLEFHNFVMNGVKNSDAVFAEISHPSTSVGYLIALAAQTGKPVVCFYNGDKKPHLFNTLEEQNDKFIVVEYHELEDLNKLVPEMIEFIHEGQDTRFNFFVTPKHINYMNWIAKTRRIPRSVFLRKLIEEEMKKSSNY